MLKMNKMVAKISRGAHKVVFKMKKHSPEILVTAGIAGGIAATVVACKQTIKLEGVLANKNEEMEAEKEKLEKVENYEELVDEKDNYTAEDAEEDKKVIEKNMRLIKFQTCVKVAKLYAPAVLIGGLSIAAILTSNNIMRKRNLALAASLASVNSAFEEYRKRVVAKYGEDVDYEMITGKSKDDVVIDAETGKPEETEQKELASPTCKYYDETCKGYTGDPNLDLMTLRAKQDALTNKLKVQGHLFLNEVYDELGVTRTPIGQRLGWLYDEKNPAGDNFVDFGIYDDNSVANRRFVNGLDKYVLLNFNIDGDIVDKI